MISQEIVDLVINTSKIEEVVGDFVSLRKAGSNYKGLCPFHDEKTPSFVVSPAKEIYKCFGCGKSGNSVGFVMEHEDFTFPEAIKFLANKYNIEIKEEELSPEQKQQNNEIESIYIVLKFAQKFYTDFLHNTNEGRQLGVQYLKSRGFSDDTINKFEIGFSPVQRDSFTKNALDRGYKEDFLIKAGLTTELENQDNIDRFRERVMFPIHSVAGRILGFGARTLKSDKKIAKYLNTAETIVYNKSNVLYGLYFAKSAIRKKDFCLLVEGYTDVMAMYQIGIENVVSSSGTSLTTAQIKLIKRYSENITLLFDGDKAGINAALRGVDLVLKEGLKVKIVILPEGEDPDSFCKQKNAEEVEKYIEEEAKDFIFFKLDLFLDKNLTNDPIKKVEAIRNIIFSIAQIPEKLERNLYIKEVGKILDVSEQDLYLELDKVFLKKRDEDIKKIEREIQKEEQSGNKIVSILPESNNKQEMYVLKMLLLHGNKKFDKETLIAEEILMRTEEIEWDNEIIESIVKEYKSYWVESEKCPEIKYFTNHKNVDFQKIAVDFALDKYVVSPHWNQRTGRFVEAPDKNYIRNTISALNILQLKKIVKLLQENTQKLKQINADDSDDFDLHLKLHIELNNMKVNISERTKSVIVY